ncbi:hypothetical protein L2E82_06355 [Cichorium intybus]|uniref:Uncharacterized protein n=1 Tax=Cichorium intybus TaxID=13427 RepID=A0ACB9HB08_CICIN|nr:hypothetical protein L2E82_06355 [Cichorium intybus]
MWNHLLARINLCKTKKTNFCYGLLVFTILYLIQDIYYENYLVMFALIGHEEGSCNTAYFVAKLSRK